MPVYNGNTKQGTLYYGGSKIKEAYYGGDKVYTTNPIFYCFKTDFSWYYYSKYDVYPIPQGTTVYSKSDFTQANSSSELNYTFTASSSFTAPKRYQAGDLYT